MGFWRLCASADCGQREQVTSQRGNLRTEEREEERGSSFNSLNKNKAKNLKRAQTQHPLLTDKWGKRERG